MHRFRLAVLLCEPTLVGGTLTVILAILLLTAANFSFLVSSGLLYDGLLGENSSLDLIQSSRDSASAISQTIFGNPILNQVIFFAFWMMVGLFVYVSITALGQTFSEAENDLKSFRYVHARKKLIERNILVRLAIRIGGLLAGLLFGWVFLRLLFPFSVFSSRVGLDQLSKPIGWLYIALAGIVMILSLHTLVIIARLIVVRPRVFGSWDSLLQK